MNEIDRVKERREHKRQRDVNKHRDKDEERIRKKYRMRGRKRKTLFFVRTLFHNDKTTNVQTEAILPSGRSNDN